MKKGVQQGFSENASYKVVALLITLILWVIILGSKEAALVKMIPCNYILPKDTVITTDVPKEIAFRLTGPRLPLKRFSETVEPLAVDLSSALEGSTTIRIHPDSIDVPPGIRVISVSPATITAKLEHIISSKVLVEANLIGSLPPSFKLGRVNVTPSEVELTGPRGAIEKLKKVLTTPVDLSTLDGPIIKNLDLQISDASVKPQNPETHVTLSLEVKRK